MEDKPKIYITFLVILAVMVSVSGCINNTNSNQTDKISTKTYNNTSSGISFNYPADWEILPQLPAKYNLNVVNAVGDPKTRYATSNNPVYGNITIDSTAFVVAKSKRVLSVQQISQLEKNAIASDKNSQVVSERNMTVDGVPAIERVYKSPSLYDNETLQSVSIWFEKNGNLYNIAYCAKANVFDSEKPKFDLIMNSLKIQ